LFLTPVDVSLKLQQDDGNLLFDPSSYQQLIKSLNYLTITRPNISFVAQVSQFIQAPLHSYLVTIQCILRYLKGPSSHGLFFSIATSLSLMGVLVMRIGVVVLIFIV
jgi:hypothetical protein